MTGPEPDRWAHLRDTCPHGIVRGLLTCPVCDPEAQAATEAHARASVVPPPAEELAVLRARLALSPVQVEAMEQEIAELKQEHGVLSGQLHEVRAVLDEDGGTDWSTKLTRIREIVGPWTEVQP